MGAHGADSNGIELIPSIWRPPRWRLPHSPVQVNIRAGPRTSVKHPCWAAPPRMFTCELANEQKMHALVSSSRN